MPFRASLEALNIVDPVGGSDLERIRGTAKRWR
jgi:hypothetical protein